jgi:hypothetical protein
MPTDSNDCDLVFLAGVASAPVSPRREFTCLTVALHAFVSPLLPTLRPQLHEVRGLSGSSPGYHPSCWSFSDVLAGQQSNDCRRLSSGAKLMDSSPIDAVANSSAVISMEVENKMLCRIV